MNLTFSLTILLNTRSFLIEQFYKNNEAQIFQKTKNKLRTIEAELQVQMQLQVLSEKHNTSRHYMYRFIAGLFAVRNTE